MRILAAWLFWMMAASGTVRADGGGGLGGMVLCGYQGWFRTAGDGSGNGWRHYAAGGKFEPGHASIDLWPDLTEFAPEERFGTPFRHADGRRAEVFSSVVPATVRRHFEWMRDYGIDGVFLQRFVSETKNARSRSGMDQVLRNCRESAAATDRRWALMYDLSGLRAGESQLLIADWKRLIAEGKLAVDGSDASYLRIRGKPLVALWGLGFTDRATTMDEWRELLEFFRGEAAAGGCALMLGVPTYWRTLNRDCVADERVHQLMEMADVISPWSVGRFGTPQQSVARAETLLKPDREWCAQRGLDYLPVVFPGFSWQNLKRGRGVEAAFDHIPRRGGRFLWSQAIAAKASGADSVYVAMFDEMDEATAIFKTTQDPPIGPSRFLAEPDLPTDHYLWLTGQIGRMLRGEITAGPKLPPRP